MAPSSSVTEDRRRRRACRLAMTEPPATAPSGIAASQRDVLLATKLHIPASRPDLVLRPRLTERLDEGLAGGCPGLRASWVRQVGPAGRLGLAPPAPGRRAVADERDKTRPGTGAIWWPRWTGTPRNQRTGCPLLGPPAPSSFESLVTALINDLAAEPGTDDALLVLDDYHVIGSQPVHESLAFLVEHPPAGICVVLASRSDPPLALARLRARGQLAELRAAEMRFTPGEAAALLRHTAAGSSRLSPMNRWRHWRPGPKGGPQDCSWPRCHCEGIPMWPGSWRRLPAATATSWITWPRRYSSGRVSNCARSCWRPRCWNG